MDEPYVPAAVVAERTSVTAETVREWARSGVIPGYRPGGREWLFLWSEVTSAIAQTRHVTPKQIRTGRQRLTSVPAPSAASGVSFRELRKQRQAKRGRA